MIYFKMINDINNIAKMYFVYYFILHKHAHQYI